MNLGVSTSPAIKCVVESIIESWKSGGTLPHESQGSCYNRRTYRAAFTRYLHDSLALLLCGWKVLEVGDPEIPSKCGPGVCKPKIYTPGRPKSR